MKRDPIKLQVNFLSLLITVVTVVFVALKIFGAISWDWIWVVSPIWLLWSAVVLVFIIYALLKRVVGEK